MPFAQPLSMVTYKPLQDSQNQDIDTNYWLNYRPYLDFTGSYIHFFKMYSSIKFYLMYRFVQPPSRQGYQTSIAPKKPPYTSTLQSHSPPNSSLAAIDPLSITILSWECYVNGIMQRVIIDISQRKTVIFRSSSALFQNRKRRIF